MQSTISGNNAIEAMKVPPIVLGTGHTQLEILDFLQIFNNHLVYLPSIGILSCYFFLLTKNWRKILVLLRCLNVFGCINVRYCTVTCFEYDGWRNYSGISTWIQYVDCLMTVNQYGSSIDFFDDWLIRFFGHQACWFVKMLKCNKPCKCY